MQEKADRHSWPQTLHFTRAKPRRLLRIGHVRGRIHAGSRQVERFPGRRITGEPREGKPRGSVPFDVKIRRITGFSTFPVCRQGKEQGLDESLYNPPDREIRSAIPRLFSSRQGEHIPLSEASEPTAADIAGAFLRLAKKCNVRGPTHCGCKSPASCRNRS